MKNIQIQFALPILKIQVNTKYVTVLASILVQFWLKLDTIAICICQL